MTHTRCTPQIVARRAWIAAASAVWLHGSCHTAHAAGSGMPWEAPLQRILESIEGPVAKVVAVVVIIVTGLSLSSSALGLIVAHLLR